MVIVATIAILTAAGWPARRSASRRSTAYRLSSLRATSLTAPRRARALVTPEAPGATEPLVEVRRGAY